MTQKNTAEKRKEHLTVRIMTAVSPELNEKLMTLCKAYGMSKSGLVAYYVGKMVDTETRFQNLVNQETVNELVKTMVMGQNLGNLTEQPDMQLTFEDDEN